MTNEQPDQPKGSVNAERLKSFIERIERLTEEKKAISGDIKEVFAEAKSTGYDTKVMKRLIAERAKDAADRQEEQALFETYARAVGMVIN